MLELFANLSMISRSHFRLYNRKHYAIHDGCLVPILYCPDPVLYNPGCPTKYCTTFNRETINRNPEDETYWSDYWSSNCFNNDNSSCGIHDQDKDLQKVSEYYHLIGLLSIYFSFHNTICHLFYLFSGKVVITTPY